MLLEIYFNWNEYLLLIEMNLVFTNEIQISFIRNFQRKFKTFPMQSGNNGDKHGSPADICDVCSTRTINARISTHTWLFWKLQYVFVSRHVIIVSRQTCNIFCFITLSLCPKSPSRRTGKDATEPRTLGYLGHSAYDN